jgi:hypothetical protein
VTEPVPAPFAPADEPMPAPVAVPPTAPAPPAPPANCARAGTAASANTAAVVAKNLRIVISFSDVPLWDTMTE